MTAHEWAEENIYGRYEVTLTVDVGTSEAMHQTTARMREFARTLPVLGHQVRANYIVGEYQERDEAA